MRIIIPDDLRTKCRDIAQRRRSNAINKNLTPANGASAAKQWAMSADRLGSFGEGAAWEWMKRKPIWHDVLDRFSDLPDLEINNLKIDVKAVARAWHTLIAHKVRDDWAYLLVAEIVFESEFVIQGWAWGVEVKEFPVEERQQGRPAYVLPNNRKGELRKPEELLLLAGFDDQGIKRAWSAYYENPGDDTLRVALDATPCIQDDKQRWMGGNL